MKKSWLIIILAGIAVTTVSLIAFRLQQDDLDDFNMYEDEFFSVSDAYEEFDESYFDEEESLLTLYSDEIESIPRARLVDSVSKELDDYLSILKDDMLDSFGSEDYEKMDKSEFLDSLFFEGESISEAGTEFLFNINQYRNSITENFKYDFPDIVMEVEEEFSTDPVTNMDGEEREWLRFNYHGFPLVASMTKMTQLQVTIKNVKIEILEGLLEEEY